MITYYDSANDAFVKSLPIVRQLHNVFNSIPDETLIAVLKAHTGRPGYRVEVLWKTYVASVVLGLPTFAIAWLSGATPDSH